MPVIVRLDTPTERYIAFQLISYGEDQRLLMLRDVTREVRLEQMRKDFVANASHELRSPLTVVAGYLENFQRRTRAWASWRRPIAEMRRQTDRMTRIIEDLLELSRFEANDAPIKGLPIDVAAMARCCARTCSRGPRIRARSRSSSNRRASLIGDEAMVQSAFSNLVDNAAKYTPPDGSMQIRWWTDERGRAFLRARHRARAFPPNTFRGSPSASIASIRAARARPAARASGSPSSSMRCIATAGGSRSRASKAAAARSPATFPHERVLERRVAASA